MFGDFRPYFCARLMLSRSAIGWLIFATYIQPRRKPLTKRLLTGGCGPSSSSGFAAAGFCSAGAGGAGARALASGAGGAGCGSAGCANEGVMVIETRTATRMDFMTVSFPSLFCAADQREHTI